MALCNFNDIREYLKKKEDFVKYTGRNFLYFKENIKSSNLWSYEFHDGLGVWDFFIFPSALDSIRSRKTTLKHENFFKYDFKNFKEEKGNPLMKPEILTAIFRNTYLCQRKTSVKPEFMSYQPDINGKMRAILIDWLIDVHNKFKLVPKTLHLTVTILDRFLNLKSLVRQKLQLLGITSMLLASKHEEIYAPETQDFVYISDKTYTKEDIFKMETLVCSTLKYKFSSPSSFLFLSFWLKFIEATEEEIVFSIYCIELTLLELSILKFPPKTIAASVTLTLLDVMRPFFDKKNHRETILFYEKFFIEENELEACSDFIKSFLILNQNGRRRLTSIKRKYSLEKYKQISSAIFSICF